SGGAAAEGTTLPSGTGKRITTTDGWSVPPVAPRGVDGALQLARVEPDEVARGDAALELAAAGRDRRLRRRRRRAAAADHRLGKRPARQQRAVALLADVHAYAPVHHGGAQRLAADRAAAFRRVRRRVDDLHPLRRFDADHGAAVPALPARPRFEQL